MWMREKRQESQSRTGRGMWAAAGVRALVLLAAWGLWGCARGATPPAEGWEPALVTAPARVEAGATVPAQAAAEPPAPVAADQPVPVAVDHPAPPAPDPLVQAAAEPPVLVPYEGPVEHIFFHPLILYPELAFDGDSLTQGYNDWFVTVPEFRHILTDLYQNGYMLVDIRDLFEITEQDGHPVVRRNPLQLPPGKKPLVLSIDDLNFYDYMRANGNGHRLVLDTEGQVATLAVTPDGREVVARDNGIVPILDRFVAQHPDFSFRGAKGLIALTGYEGILGYRTHDPDRPDYEQEKAAALAVVQRLKETGWSFASHGWGHLDAARVRYQTLVRDTARWKAEVEPLVGPTPFYVFPHGSRVAPGDPRFQALLDAGFRVFLGVGPTPYLEANGDHILMDRRHIDGLALQTQAADLAGLFDATAALDPARP